MDVSFGTIWEAVAGEMPDAVAISEPGRDFTYAEFADRAARLAAAFVAAGVGPGDKVACYLYNGAAYLETVFAAFKIGAVPVNANYRYTRTELTSLLVDADAAALVFSSELAENVTHAATHVPTLKILVSTDGLPDLLERTRPLAPSPRPGSDQLFMYTGGTTGTPKGVIWRLSDLLYSLELPIFRAAGAPGLPRSLAEAVEIAVTARRSGHAPTILPVVPLMHGTGMFNSMGALLVGGRVVTLRPGRLDAPHVWKTVAAQQVSTLIVAGNAVCRALVDGVVDADLTSVRSMISSGTVFSDDLKRALHERADLTIVDAIASSEGGPFAFAVTSSVDDLPSRFLPVPAPTVVDESGREVPPGAVGVLAYRGPMPLGYYKDEDKTAATFRVLDGVRHSVPGDLVRREPDGSVTFLGRGSAVINTGGEKVHPQEVEDALLAHPDVTDAVVVGAPDDTWGEIVAAVVASPSTTLTGDELRNAVRQNLAGYKIPRVIVIRTSLPRTPTGTLELAWAREQVT
jgi:acyl-CoA synthetase (AMP-forming)/AMP-acid ligase II